jgi:hypothetical protein
MKVAVLIDDLFVVSHAQIDLKERAEQAGASEVLPRSAFVQPLPDLFG